MNDLKKLCDAVTKAATCKNDQVPKGWMTARQISKTTNKSMATTHRKLNVLKDENKVEVRKFRVMTERGSYPVIHYRYAKTTKAGS